MSVEITRLRELDNLELKRARCAGQRFPLHFHEALSLGVVAAGRERITVGGETQVVGPGEVVVLAPGEVHAHAGVGDAAWQYLAIYVSPDVVARRRRALGVDGPIAPVIEAPEIYRQLVEAHAAASPARVVAVLDELLVRHRISGRVAARPRVDVHAAGDYLRAHHAQKIAVGELAARFGLGPYQFVRAFRRAFGLTPTAFQIVERINRAQQLLADGATVARAGLEAGFYDQSHFVRFFRRFTGTTPIDYRRQSARSYKPVRTGSLSSRHDRTTPVRDGRRPGRMRG